MLRIQPYVRLRFGSERAGLATSGEGTQQANTLHSVRSIQERKQGDVTEREQWMMDFSDEGVNDSSSPGPEKLKRCRVRSDPELRSSNPASQVEAGQQTRFQSALLEPRPGRSQRFPRNKATVSPSSLLTLWTRVGSGCGHTGASPGNAPHG